MRAYSKLKTLNGFNTKTILKHFIIVVVLYLGILSQLMVIINSQITLQKTKTVYQNECNSQMKVYIYIFIYLLYRYTYNILKIF